MLKIIVIERTSLPQTDSNFRENIYPPIFEINKGVFTSNIVVMPIKNIHQKLFQYVNLKCRSPNMCRSNITSPTCGHLQRCFYNNAL